MGDWARELAHSVLALHQTLRKSDRFHSAVKPPRNEEATMSQQTVIAKGAHLFGGLVELTAKLHKCSTSRAVDIVLKSQSGRDALALAKQCDGAAFLKLGDGDAPQGVSQHSGAAQTSLDAIPAAQQRARNKYLARIKELVDGGMTASRAHDQAQREMPDEWITHKMLPPSNDGNSPRMRGPYEGTTAQRSYAGPVYSTPHMNITR
jgi:hypothetical protein